MRVPPKDDPGGDKEAALPLSTVIHVLQLNDVTVEEDSGFYTLVSEDGVEVQQFTDPVGGMMVRYLARKFRINAVHFYYPKEGEADRPSVH